MEFKKSMAGAGHREEHALEAIVASAQKMWQHLPSILRPDTWEDERMRSAVIGALMVAAPLTAAAQRAENVCLPLNRVLSTKVIDNRTILATDYQHRQYSVHMRQRCVGLDQFAQNLSFRRAAEVGSEYLCIQQGDTIGYSLPGDPSMGARSITVHGAQAQMLCTIESVTPGPP
jgi:hypothetical protein